MGLGQGFVPDAIERDTTVEARLLLCLHEPVVRAPLAILQRLLLALAGAGAAVRLVALGCEGLYGLGHPCEQVRVQTHGPAAQIRQKGS